MRPLLTAGGTVSGCSWRWAALSGSPAILVVVYMDLAQPNPEVPFVADLLFFLHTVPFMAALALMPHARKMRETLRYGFIDFLLLAFLWLYIYVFPAMPWKIISPNRQMLHSHDFVGYLIENLVVAAGFGVLFLRARGWWRTVYGNLFGARSLYVSG